MSGREKTRAVVLASIMVVSVLGAGVALTGGAAAQDGGPDDGNETDLELNLSSTEPFTATGFEVTGGDDGFNVGENQIPEGQDYARLEALRSTSGGGLNFTAFGPLPIPTFGIDKNGDDPGNTIDVNFLSFLEETGGLNDGSGFVIRFQENASGQLPRVEPGDEIVVDVSEENGIQTGPAGIYTFSSAGVPVNGSVEPVTTQFVIGNPTRVNECQVIDESGNYALTENITTPQQLCFDIQADNVSFNGGGHTIEHTGDKSGDGILAQDVSDANVRFTRLTGWDDGIEYNDVDEGIIEGNTLDDTVGGVEVEDSSGLDVTDNSLTDNSNYGVELRSSDGNDIVDNTVTNNGNESFGGGVSVIGGSQDNTVADNTVTDNRNGIESFTGSDTRGEDFDNNNVYSNNDVSNNSANGFSLFYEAGSTVRNNTVANNDGGAGILLGSGDRNDIVANDVSSNDGNGIELAGVDEGGSNDNTLTDNMVVDNSGAGVQLGGSNTADNLIYDNLLNQSNNVAFEGNAADNDNDWNVEPRIFEENVVGGSATGGNYYAGPNGEGYSQTCTNADFNQFCDDPLDVDDESDDGDDDNTDFYPLAQTTDIEVEPPEELQFGEVRVDDNETREVTITNDGEATLNINNTTLVGFPPERGFFGTVTGPPDVQITKNLSEDERSLEPGENASIELTFNPDVPGAQEGSLVIRSDDPDEPRYTVTVSGEGVAPEIEVSPNSVDYGNVTVNESEDRTVSVVNTGDAPLNVSDVRISGMNESAYTITSEGNTGTIAAGESRAVTVALAPDSPGTKDATLVIENNDMTPEGFVPEETKEVPLTGNAVEAEEEPEPEPQGEIEVAESAMFGGVEVGDSADRTVTVVNDGDGPVEVIDTSIDGADGAEFNVVDNPAGNAQDDESFTLAAGEERDLTIRFEPDSTGEKNARLVTDTENDGTETTALAGTGTSAAENTITIVGSGEEASYDLSVTDDLQKSTANGANINARADTIRQGYVADGEVGSSADSYTYDGTLETIDLDGDAEVIVNGNTLTDAQIENMPDNAIEFRGTGPRATYDFSSDDESVGLQKLTANDANLNDNDDVFRTTANGVAGAGRDAYGFDGSIESLDAPDSLEVYVDGLEVDPDDTQDNVVTILGSGERATYDLSVASNLAKSTANFANVNARADTVSGNSATGEVGGSADSYVYDGDLDIDLDGDATVVVDGEQIDA